MNEKIYIDALTESGVSIRWQKYVIEEGQEYYVGDPHRCAYINSERGRLEITQALTEPYLSAVMALWGDTPTVTETEFD
mgnify:CR=1 FL=1